MRMPITAVVLGFLGAALLAACESDKAVYQERSVEEIYNGAMDKLLDGNVSQAAVVDEEGTVKGIIDESDILQAIVDDADAFSNPVSDYMTRKLETVSPDTPISDLLPIFSEDKVAIVVEDKQFLGLITRMDHINYLRKQLTT